MTRIRVKHEIDGEIPAADLLADRDFTNSYTTPERGGIQRTDRAITTYHLPHYRGMPSYSQVLVHPSTMLAYKETTHVPYGPQPYGLTG
jgi:hypothetical protein